MSEYIFYADRLVSCQEPYIFDKFVSAHHRKITYDDVSRLVEVYKALSKNNQMLAGLLKHLSKLNRSNSVNVKDIGVFMGSFSTAIHLCANSHDLNANIDAYEANPLLISSIIKNFLIYDVKADLHWAAIGKERGSQEIVVNQGSAIGGGLANTERRKVGDFFSCNVDVLPLSEILAGHEDVDLVKIDIEGYEVSAFSSIFDCPEKIRNVFIVEYAPNQGAQKISELVSYDDFLFTNFRIFNIGNWAWFSRATPIKSSIELTNCDLGNGGHNTDLLLIPKSLEIDPSDF